LVCWRRNGRSGRGRVEVDGVAGAEGGFVIAVADGELAGKHIEKLESGVHVGLGLDLRGRGRNSAK